MEMTTRVAAGARGVLACALSAVLAAALVPAAAFAAADQDAQQAYGAQLSTAEVAEMTAEALTAAEDESDYDGSVGCGNGWVLGYKNVYDSDGQTISGVSIAGVTKAGEGKLEIPETADGYDVIALSDSAFSGSTALGEVVLPDTLADLGMYAFLSSSVTSVNIPAAVERIPYRCFALCSELCDVQFEGDSLRYLSQQSFRSCTSLEEIEIPLLTSSPTYAEMDADGLNSGSVSFGAAIGASCFEGCTSLVKIVFGGPVTQDQVDYFANTSCLANCSASLEIIYKGATVSIPSGTSTSSVLSTGALYYTLDFYASKDDAETPSYENSMGSVTCKAVSRSKSSSGNLTSTYLVRIFQLLYGGADYSDLIYEGSVPECPDGKVWGIVGTSMSEYAFMSGSYQVVAVDPEDVQYGWVSSPSISEFDSLGSATSVNSMNNSSDYATLDMEADGSIPELSEIAAYASDGTKLDSGAYTLAFEKATITYDSSGRSSTSWSDIAFDDITEAGTYRVHAVGTGDYSESETGTVTFVIERAEPDVTAYYDANSASAYLGKAAYDTAASMDDAAAYNVIVPSGDWRNQLLGAGFAGAGGGLLLTDCRSDYSSRMTQAAVLSGADSYIMMGDTYDVPQSKDTSDEVYLADFIDEKCGTSSTRYGAGTTTAQELATSAISKFKPANWGATWGGIAVVASSTDELRTEAAAQYVYQNAARVFFLDDDGQVSSEDLLLLSSSDITQIVVIGDTGCVSSAVEESIAKATGKTTTRILEGDTAGAASLSLAQDLVSSGTNSWSTVVIADSTDSANVSTAAVMAAVEGGVLLTCRTSADAKAIEAYLESLVLSEGLGVVEDICTIGEFGYLDDAAELFLTAWNSDYGDLDATAQVTLSAGDTFEVNGYVYRITGDKTASLCAVSGAARYSTAPSSVSYDGVTYSVASVATFPDVLDASKWYYEGIYYVANLSLMTGYGNTGLFGVGKTLKRSELASILWRDAEPGEYAAWLASGTYGNNETGMADVKSGAWYTDAANWAVENGIINGNLAADGTRTFDPSDDVTFEQLLTILSNYLSNGEGSEYSTDILSSFSDSAQVHSWAASSVAWCADNGVFSGVSHSDGTYTIEPRTSVNRERAAVVFYNVLSAGIM